MADPSFGSLFRLYENIRWDLRGHEQMKHLWFVSLPTHSGDQRELEMLRLSQDMLLRQVQERFVQVLPSEIKRISCVPDDRVAAQDLAMLVGVGFYIYRFGSWDDAKAQIQKMVSDEAARGRVLGIFKRIEASKAPAKPQS